MITINFKKILARCIFSSTANGKSTPVVSSDGTEVTTLRLTSGEEIRIAPANTTTAQGIMGCSVNMMNHISLTSGSIGTLYLKVGTGTTVATEDDYELETVNTDVSCDVVVVGTSVNHTKTYTATFSNPTSNDITVTEVGLYGYIYVSTSENADFLLDRTVLNTPITIPAGESKPITYELSF